MASSAQGVFVTDPSLSSSSPGGSEPSIAVNPANPNQIAITRFTFAWNGNADLLYSADGGLTWTDQSTIPPPPGVAGTAGCPCDQTIDYGRDGRLYGTFLTASATATTVVTGSTTDPTNASSWSWNGNPAQLTSGTRTAADQPWLLVNRDPVTAGQDDVYVAYDDFAAGPDARVAASYGANPVNITVDSKAGTESPLATNPGLRLARDPRNGTMYALYEQSIGTTQPKTVTYKLNRSTDGGGTWTLNGSADGLTVDTVSSDQAPGFKFGTVNALLGGVEHAAVDPSSGDVYVVYGQDVSGGNQIKIRRLQANGTGGLNVGPATNVSLSTNAALPSVAVLTDGTIGVLYDSFDGIVSGLPRFSAHLARIIDHGASFSDLVLESFQSPVADNGNPRQRVLGDYQQIKAVGTTFYGVFSGNRNVFNPSVSTIDPMFFNALGLTPNEVGVAGTDSGLWRLQDTPPPTPFTGLGGFILAAPAVVSVPTPSGQSGSPIYIATGADHALWVRSQTQGWRPLAASGSYCIDNPAGVVVQSKPAGSLIFVAACQGGDHALWYAQEPISPGALPDPSLAFQSLGGQMLNGPAVAAINPLGAVTVNAELTFFVNGTDGHVWTRTVSAGWSPQPWSCIGHPAASTVAIQTPPPRFQGSVFACQGTNGHLWVAINLGAGWSPAFDAGGLIVDGPGAAADPEGPVVYAEGLDGAVWRFDGTWSRLGGGVLYGVGAAALEFLNATGSLRSGSWGFRSP